MHTATKRSARQFPEVPATTKPPAINPRVVHVLGAYTDNNTGYELWAEFLFACKDGHTPTLKTNNPEQVALGIALESQGCTVEWRS